jgi:S-adenosylmethionine synthetase
LIKTRAFSFFIDEQSSDIAVGVNASVEYKKGSGDEMDLLGAGDQGTIWISRGKRQIKLKY